MEFMLKYAGMKEFKTDFDTIKAYLEDWGTNGMGKNDRGRLRHENHAKALPPYFTGHSMVRLYCCLVGENIMILGNGGHKVNPDDRHQDSPFLKPHFEFFNQVIAKLDRSLADRTIRFNGKDLTGDLEIWL